MQAFQSWPPQSQDKGSREALIRDMLFADDAAVTTHTQQELQALMARFSQACKDFGLTISLKKTNVLGQDTMELPAITINDYELECPTPRSCPEPTFRACSSCSDSAGCVGWGMSTAWRMAASQKTFSNKNWHLEGDPKAAHNCATRMSARET